MYKLIVPKEEFKKIISFSKKALPPVHFIKDDTLEHLLFNIENQNMIVRGTNLDFKAWGLIEITNESKNNLKFTLNSKILEKLITKIDIPNIEMHYDENSGNIKIFTTENKKSYITLKSLPIETISSFEKPESSNIINKYTINKDLLLTFLEISQDFLPDEGSLLIDESINSIVIRKDYMYATNGVRINLIQSLLFKDITEYIIKKSALPLYLDILKTTKENEIILIETKDDYCIETKDGNMFFSSTKPEKKPIEIPKIYLKDDSSYIMISKDKLLKAIERLSVLSKMPLPLFEITIKEDNLLEISVVGDDNLNSTDNSKNSVEYVECSKLNNDLDNIVNLIDYKTLKIVIKSSDTEIIKISFKPKEKYFAIYTTNDTIEPSYKITGVGAYSKIKYI